MKRKISFALIMMLTLGLCIVKPVSVLADDSTPTISILTMNKNGNYPINGAKYRLEKKLGDSFITVSGMENFTVYSDGFELGELTIGTTYRLTEIETLVGYSLLSEAVEFEVTSSGVSFNGNYGSNVVLNENEGNYQIVVYNEMAGFFLPSTGGNGTTAYTIGGLTLMLLGVFTIIYTYKKESIYGK